MTVPSEPPVPREPGKGRRGKLKPKHIGAAIVLVLIVIFMLENLRKVPIRFIGPEVRAPLFLALLVSAILGAPATLAIQRLRRRG